MLRYHGRATDMIKASAQFRSIIEEDRFRLEKLEKRVKDFIDYLDIIRYKNPDLYIAYLEYLKWCLVIIETVKSNHQNNKKKINLNNVVDFCSSSIRNMSKQKFDKFNINLLKQPKLGYGTFLEAGLEIYSIYIDFYQLWYSKDNILKLIQNSSPDAASYAFIAMLARFTLPSSNPIYLHLYITNLKKAKNALPQAYKEPSYDNILALMFLCFIYTTQYNIISIVRYFSLAVRMAQLLGYDKYDNEGIITTDPNDKDVLLKIRGGNLWKSITLSYYYMRTYIPNLPTFNTTFKPVALSANLNSNVKENNSISDYHSSDTFSVSDLGGYTFKDEKIITEALSEIQSHIQTVKLEHFGTEKVEYISNEELRLPSEKFNKVLNLLVSLGSYEISDMGSLDDESPNGNFFGLCRPKSHPISNLFTNQSTIFSQSTIIFLYYPSVLVFPRAVKFPYNESIILYKAVQMISNYYFKMDLAKKSDPKLFSLCYLGCKSASSAHNDGFCVNYYMPYCSQLAYVIFVYLSFISEYKWMLSQGFTFDMIANSKDRVLGLINILKGALESKFNVIRIDSRHTLRQISEALENFNLHEPFCSSVNSMLLDSQF